MESEGFYETSILIWIFTYGVIFQQGT
jgi:hypothetical protein